MCYCVQMTLICHFNVGYPPPPPPLHPIIHKIIINNLFCECNVQMSFESWGLNSNHHTMCMDNHIPKAKISLILQHFLFWPFPTFTPPAHAPFKKSYKVCYGLIGNYPSFKMIPNTTYIVLILKKYNRSKSWLLTLCAGNIFRWRWCVKKKNVFYANIVCSNEAEICRWQNTR